MNFMAIANALAQNILLVGSGQLGSRYLQGLSDVQRQLSITVVDQSEASLDVARNRLSEVSTSCRHKVDFTTSLDNVPLNLELALLAWVLEKLLAQSSKQVDCIEHALEGQSQVWVNTPRRLMHWHHTIKQQLLDSSSSVFRVRVFGGSWGMACNSIHFIDLVNWWTGSRVKDVVSTGLEDWQPSKRPGFHEVFGSLIVNFCDGCSLELSSSPDDLAPRIEVETSDGIWVIDETLGKAVSPSGQVIAGQLTYQSHLTSPLVEQILSNGCCDLPVLADSASQHRPFLDALLHHWNQSQSRDDLVVPIT